MYNPNVGQLTDSIIEGFYNENPQVRYQFLQVLKNNGNLINNIIAQGCEVARANQGRVDVQAGITISLLFEYFKWIASIGRPITAYDNVINPNVVRDVEYYIDTLQPPQQIYQPPRTNQGYQYGNNVVQQGRSYGGQTYPTENMSTRSSRIEGHSNIQEPAVPQFQPPRSTTTPQQELVQITSRVVTFGIIPIATTNKENTMNKNDHESFYDSLVKAKALDTVSPPTATLSGNGGVVDKKERVSFDISYPKASRLIDETYPIDSEDGDPTRYSDVSQWFSTSSASNLAVLANSTGRYLYHGEITLSKELRVLDNDLLANTLDGLERATLDTIDTLLTGLEDNKIIHSIDANMLRRSILLSYNNIVFTRLGLSPFTFSNSLDRFTTKDGVEIIPALKKKFNELSTSPIKDSLDFELELHRAITENIPNPTVVEVEGDDDSANCIVFDRTIGIGYVSIPVTDFMFGGIIKKHGYCMATSDTLKDLKKVIMDAIDKFGCFALMTSDGYILNITTTCVESKNKKDSPYGGVIFVSDISTVVSYERIMELYSQKT